MAAVEDRMWFYRALHAHIEGALIAASAGRPLNVLDAGCGTGGLIRRLQPRHPEWHWSGVDVEPLACELARQRCSAAIVEASVLRLPFADETFDAVVSADVLYHLDDDFAAVREFHRVLRPGGLLVVNVPAHRWLWSYHDVTVHGRRRYSRTGLAGLLARGGFAGVDATHWNTLPLPLVYARRRLWRAPATGSDVRLYPTPLESLFNATMALERVALRTGLRFPIGCSLFAVARRS